MEKSETMELKSKTHAPSEARQGGDPETYPAPPPPSKGRIIGIDCHPDIFTAAVFEGTTPHDASQLEVRGDVTFEELLSWAGKKFTREDLFLLEAGGNSFEVCRQFAELGFRAVVLESAHVGRHAKIYADNDKIAAARIVRVYLAGQAPCVWVPDDATIQRRELLHAYSRAVAACTETTNALKGFLNQWTIRAGRRSLAAPATHQWILGCRDWSPLQKILIDDHLAQILQAAARRKTLQREIGRQIVGDPAMLGLMGLLGIGVINAFALVAVIGDISRFANPRKLVAYLGLNPGQRESGSHKRIKVGIGRRGRRDMRTLLVQGAHAVLRSGRHTELGKWGWRLFARKGNRNIAVGAVARKLATQAWHLLSGNTPELLEPSKSRQTKLTKLTVMLGKALRTEMQLPPTISDCIVYFDNQILESKKHLQT
jgi:transposase